MRLPLTKYGLPQVLIFPVVIIGAMILFLIVPKAFLPIWGIVFTEAILTVVLIWVLSFFRDPERIVPADKNVLLAPADGEITGINIVEDNDFLGAKAWRISIFLSIFNVHINRAPCNALIEKIIYKKGSYRNAANPISGKVNESNDLFIVRTDEPKDRLIVRQISGAIARRIICEAVNGQKLACGEKFGMIKFGSRTELYVPVRDNAKPLVKTGDKVKAGVTGLLRYI